MRVADAGAGAAVAGQENPALGGGDSLDPLENRLRTPEAPTGEDGGLVAGLRGELVVERGGGNGLLGLGRDDSHTAIPHEEDGEHKNERDQKMRTGHEKASLHDRRRNSQDSPAGRAHCAWGGHFVTVRVLGFAWCSRWSQTEFRADQREDHDPPRQGIQVTK